MKVIKYIIRAISVLIFAMAFPMCIVAYMIYWAWELPEEFQAAYIASGILSSVVLWILIINRLG